VLVTLVNSLIVDSNVNICYHSR